MAPLKVFRLQPPRVDKIYTEQTNPSAWPSYALGAICVHHGVHLLKKSFFYLSYRVLGPMRNRVITRLRADLYSKILILPIGFFTDQRKGDINSRMSNDMNEIEWSIISTLEGYPGATDNTDYSCTLIFLSPRFHFFYLYCFLLPGLLLAVSVAR